MKQTQDGGHPETGTGKGKNMKTKMICKIIVRCLVLLAVAIIGQAKAAPVHVEANKGRFQEHGAGISVGKGSECFVVVPQHVVELAHSILVTDSKGRSAAARPYQAPDGVDAALLKVESGHTMDCPEDWDDGSAGEAMLAEADFLISMKVKQGGSKQRRRGFLGEESSTTMTVQPFSSTKSDRYVEGDSGSAIYAKNRLVGMVVAVDTATGVGVAIKQSQLHALFGNLVLEQSVQRALINPVYYRNREDRYATIGIKDFVDTETTLQVVMLDSQAAAANLQNVRRGIPPVYPDNLDYIVSTSIIDNRARNEKNPHYKASAAKEKNFGKQLLNNLGNRTHRYIYVSNIDVEVHIVNPEDSEQMTHIAQLEYKVPLTDDVDQNALRKELPARAAVDALRETMVKYGLPVIARQDGEKEEETGILGLLLNGKD